MRPNRTGFRLLVLGLLASLLLSTIVSASPAGEQLATTYLAVSPFEIEPTTEIAENGYLQFTHHWLGYTEIWSSGNPYPDPQGTIYIPVHTLLTQEGRPLRLQGVEVCYQATEGSRIDRTSIYYANDAGGRTLILDSEDDQASTSWMCFRANADTPQRVAGPLLIYFMLDFYRADIGDKVTIGQITLKLAN